jgi:hypothetical protein
VLHRDGVNVIFDLYLNFWCCTLGTAIESQRLVEKPESRLNLVLRREDSPFEDKRLELNDLWCGWWLIHVVMDSQKSPEGRNWDAWKRWAHQILNK